MNQVTPFQLDPISPSMRAELIETKRRKTRESVAAHAKRTKEAGNAVLKVFLPAAVIQKIDAERSRRKLRGRADALVSILNDIPGIGNSDRVLISVASARAALLDNIVDAKGFKNRSAAIEMVIDTILANPALKQELGL